MVVSFVDVAFFPDATTYYSLAQSFSFGRRNIARGLQASLCFPGHTLAGDRGRRPLTADRFTVANPFPRIAKRLKCNRAGPHAQLGLFAVACAGMSHENSLIVQVSKSTMTFCCSSYPHLPPLGLSRLPARCQARGFRPRASWPGLSYHICIFVLGIFREKYLAEPGVFFRRT